MRQLVRSLILFMVLVPTMVSASDPFEPMNRKIQRFNDVADEKVLQPVARGYAKVLPDPVRRGVNNFFGNLRDVSDIVNNFLQGKPKQGFSDMGRVLVNTTVGLGGLLDPATSLGLVDHREDFAQTLAVWGVPRGPYVVLPFLGPSYVRDVLTRAADSRLDPLRYYYPVDHRNRLLALRLINQRAELLAADSVVFGDRYLFFRDAYSQRREFLEKDGEVEDAFGDEF